MDKNKVYIDIRVLDGDLGVKSCSFKLSLYVVRLLMLVESRNKWDGSLNTSLPIEHIWAT